MTNNISSLIKKKRKEVGITQAELSLRAGVGLRFIRDLEQGKETLRLDKVNIVLDMFGYEMAPVRNTGKYHEES